MSCTKCESIIDIEELDRPYVVRTCTGCGREIKLRQAGKHGIGIVVERGDRFVFPAAFLQMSANPLKSSGHLTIHGLQMFAGHVFGIDLSDAKSRDDVPATLRKIIESAERFFRDAEILRGLDVESEADADEIWNRLAQDKSSLAWFGYLAGAYGDWALRAVEAGNAAEAAWAMAVSERFRSLAIFKENFEEVVFMGHSAKRLVDLLRIWDANKENSDEGYWQIILKDHAYAFSQLFSVPVTFIQGTAFVGGTKLDGSDSRYLDFMLSGGNANHAILVEIKTPATRLMAGKYRRNVYPPSRDLSGAVVQVNDYCDVLRKDVDRLTKGTGLELNTFNPRRVVLIGNYEKELTDPPMRSSFELFRSSLTGIDIITFDEFFRKIEHLAKLFNIVRS